jgi:hypothetical protein
MSTITATTAIPTRTPPAMSSGWCMPRYMRANATKIGIAVAAAQIATWAARFRIREVTSSAIPP